MSTALVDRIDEPAVAIPTTCERVWGYRPALDGLRCLAVYMVVVFHAGVAEMSGGFVGVDVFFVLSGFLVTKVICEARRTGRFTFAQFYARRVRRLLPAAIVAVIGICAASVLVQPRGARISMLGDAQASMLYIANWHFLGEATNYFADPVEQSPFLHFWSLAVEEQFYFGFPLLLVALTVSTRRTGRSVIVPVGLGVVLLLSLVAQIRFAASSEPRAYYGTDARLYQLLAGALLAVLLRPAHRKRGTAMVVATGAMLIGVVVVASSIFDVAPTTRGIVATAFTVGAIIAVEAAPTTPLADCWRRGQPRPRSHLVRHLPLALAAHRVRRTDREPRSVGTTLYVSVGAIPFCSSRPRLRLPSCFFEAGPCRSSRRHRRPRCREHGELRSPDVRRPFGDADVGALDEHALPRVFLPPRFERYSEKSHEVMAILRSFHAPRRTTLDRRSFRRRRVASAARSERAKRWRSWCERRLAKSPRGSPRRSAWPRRSSSPSSRATWPSPTACSSCRPVPRSRSSTRSRSPGCGASGRPRSAPSTAWRSGRSVTWLGSRSRCSSARSGRRSAGTLLSLARNV